MTWYTPRIILGNHQTRHNLPPYHCRDLLGKLGEISIYHRQSQSLISYTGLDRFIPESEQWYIFWAADLMILPYEYSMLRVVYSHSTSTSLTVIISDQWWLLEVIEDKELIFESGKVNELTEKVLFLFKKDILWTKIAYINHLRMKFEWEPILEKTNNYYINNH